MLIYMPVSSLGVQEILQLFIYFCILVIGIIVGRVSMAMQIAFTKKLLEDKKENKNDKSN